MSGRALRYDCILDPTEGWTVWDNHRGLPAEAAARALIGLPRGEAEKLCELLNLMPREVPRDHSLGQPA